MWDLCIYYVSEVAVLQMSMDISRPLVREWPHGWKKNQMMNIGYLPVPLLLDKALKELYSSFLNAWMSTKVLWQVRKQRMSNGARWNGSIADYAVTNSMLMVKITWFVDAEWCNVNAV